MLNELSQLDLAYIESCRVSKRKLSRKERIIMKLAGCLLVANDKIINAIIVEPNSIGDLANEVPQLIKAGDIGAARLVWNEVQLRVETLLKEKT